MSSNNYTERERQVLELYSQGKTTRDIAKILRMSLRDINIILKKHGLNHGIAIIKEDDNNDNDHSQSNKKSTQAYKLFSEGKKPIEVAIQLNLSEKEATKYWKTKAPIQFISYLPGIKGRSFLYHEVMQDGKKTWNNSC